MSRAALRLGSFVFVLLALGGRAASADPLPKGALVRFGEPRFQHFTIGGPLAFSPDGKFVATGGMNKTVCVWSAADGRLVRTVEAAGQVFDLGWGADGKLVGLAFFGDRSYMMHRWETDGTTGLNAERQKELYETANRVPADGYIARPTLSADGRRVLLDRSPDRGERRAEVYAFAPNTPTSLAKPERVVPLPSGRGAWLSGDGKVVIAHEARTRNPQRPQRLVAFDLGAKDFDRPTWAFDLPGDIYNALAACLSPDGKRVMMQFESDAVEVWDGPSGKRLYALPTETRESFALREQQPALDLSPDGTRLVRFGRLPNGEMSGRIYDFNTGKVVVTLAPGPLSETASERARFSPDGTRVAHVGIGAVRLWDAKTGAEAVPLPGHRGAVNSVAVAPDGKTVVTGGDDLTVRGWDPETGKERWRTVFPRVHQVRLVTADVVVVEQDWGGAADAPLLDPATGKARKLPGAMAELTREKDARGDPVTSCDRLLTVSPDGKSAVTLLTSRKPALRVWSWPAGELKATLPIVPPDKLKLSSCSSAFVTTDGKQLVVLVRYEPSPVGQFSQSGPNDTAYLERWNLETGKRAEQKELGKRTTPALVSNGPRAVVVQGEVVRDAVTLETVVRLSGADGQELDLRRPGGLALSDGGALAIGAPFSFAGPIRVFDLKTGRQRQTWAAGDWYRHEVAFLPDGRLVSGGDAALVWPSGK